MLASRTLSIPLVHTLFLYTRSSHLFSLLDSAVHWPRRLTVGQHSFSFTGHDDSLSVSTHYHLLSRSLAHHSAISLSLAHGPTDDRLRKVVKHSATCFVPLSTVPSLSLGCFSCFLVSFSRPYWTYSPSTCLVITC